MRILFEAKRAFRDAIALNPSYDIAYSNLATLLFYDREYAEAAEVLEQASSLPAATYATWGNYGDALTWAPGRAAEAPSAYRRAIELALEHLSVNSQDATAHSRVAFYLAMTDESEQAVAHISTALEIDGRSSDVLRKAGQTYAALDEPEVALDHLELAVQEGYSKQELAEDPALESLRTNPRFGVLVAPVEGSR